MDDKENDKESGTAYLLQFVFNFIGLFSAFSLVLILGILIPDALRGNFQRTAELIKANPGIEPFLIFMLPVIVIAGSAWIWRYGLSRLWPRRGGG
ncbi:MAG: hypothetical protein PHN49_10130 [Candidatus Omnitrophica bacterium]|nr:hypothetical protein [Candidatus Omnitrophota bacterium]MDD5671988.1 hypothetical protein [Candidatus Omnitrophota bacterium]